MPITFSKLRNGTWGLRVAGSASWPGRRVYVNMRDGSRKESYLGHRVCRGNGYSLWTIGDAPNAPAPAPVTTAANDESDSYGTMFPPPDEPGPAHSGATVGTVIPSGRLFYHHDTRSFSAELSDLKDLFPHAAIPTELAIESAATGKLADFALNRTDRTPDGETEGWEYLCAEHGLKLLLIND